MTITNVKVKPLEKEDSKIKAVASITIDDEFVIHDIKVVEGTRGLFISMPCKKDLNGEFKDIAHPINTATRQYIQEKVIEKYKNTI